MSNIIDEKLKKIIVKTLRISSDEYHDEMEIGNPPEWDSANNVRLIQALEDEFQINIDISDAIEIESIFDIKLILRKYLEV